MALTKKQLTELRRLPPSVNRVAEAIYMLRLTQTATAEATGLNVQYINDIVRDRYQNISVLRAQKLADFFGCYIEDLFPSSEAVAS